MTGGSVETMLELWASSLREVKGRIGPLFQRERMAAGPLSQWLFAGLKAARTALTRLEQFHGKPAAFKTMPVKTDRKDARGIAQLMRLGWFRPVHCKSLPAQEVRALLTTRKLLQAKRPRCRDEPARRAARLWPEGWADHAQDRRGSGAGSDRSS